MSLCCYRDVGELPQEPGKLELSCRLSKLMCQRASFGHHRDSASLESLEGDLGPLGCCSGQSPLLDVDA